jgi:hypothetical protein
MEDWMISMSRFLFGSGTNLFPVIPTQHVHEPPPIVDICVKQELMMTERVVLKHIPSVRDFESLTESLRKCSLSLWMGLEKDPQVSLCGPCIMLIDTNLTNLPVAAIVLGSEPKKIRDDYK